MFDVGRIYLYLLLRANFEKSHTFQEQNEYNFYDSATYKTAHTKKVFWLQLYIPITKNTILLFLIPYFSTNFMEHSPYK